MSRWKRVKVGKFGRVALLTRQKYGRNGWATLWRVEGLCLNGERKIVEFGGLRDALDSQRRFLGGGRL